MPQSLSKVILHIVFSTRNREPWLDSDVRPRMHAYLATICRDLGAEFVKVGGVADHVHIVTTLPRTVSQAQMIEQMKTASSKWIKTLEARYHGFFWQRGYGIFSVSPGQLDAVSQYIGTQQDTIALAAFRRNTVSFCTSMALISMSVTSGIKNRLWN
jgi:putative transposase